MLLDYEHELDQLVWVIRMRLLRLALCGGHSGPAIAETLWALGKERSLQRLRGVEKAFEGVEEEIKAWLERKVVVGIEGEGEQEQRGRKRLKVKVEKDIENWERKVKKRKDAIRDRRRSEEGK